CRPRTRTASTREDWPATIPCVFHAVAFAPRWFDPSACSWHPPVFYLVNSDALATGQKILPELRRRQHITEARIDRLEISDNVVRPWPEVVPDSNSDVHVVGLDLAGEFNRSAVEIRRLTRIQAPHPFHIVDRQCPVREDDRRRRIGRTLPAVGRDRHML